MNKTLGIIAGSGQMPALLAHACQERLTFIVAYHGYTDPKLVEGRDHIWVTLGELGKAIAALRTRGIHEIVMAGGISRPSLRHLKVDKEGFKLLRRLGLRWPGDNHLLVTIQAFLEEEGFILKSPQDILPSLIAPKGALGRCSPPKESFQDIQKGVELLTYLSPLDFGQGLALQQGLILAIEAAEGTDQCITRAGILQSSEGSKAIYIKRAKAQQSMKLDLPVIGPKTVQELIKASFQGIAFQAYQTLILFPKEVKALADQSGLFLWGEP